ncbi:MAG: P-II family nitrogen regulator [Candidatus Methanomethylophilaceae archaeon]
MANRHTTCECDKMKMIIAYIRPERLQTVKDALKLKNVNGMTITSVRGRGSQSGLKFTNRVGEFVVDEIEKVKLEIVVEDTMEDTVIDTIVNAASTGHIGDGRIFVLPVERSIKVRSE